MITKFKELQNHLLTHAIKPTFIRLLILSYMNRSDFHPNAEEIYKGILKKIPTISRTSVYNTLSLFREKGVIIPLYLTSREARFELKKEQQRNHFLCEKCGKIIDLEFQYKYFKAEELNGHRVKGLHSCFYGICKNCLQNK
ncbi:MAG: transcriptional repressor [Candidatus Aminicenantes bacterium]|nr:transcriptional repressor [Candidatus Aminicenantes bacterium]